jgi:hypothetical protein
MRPTGGRAQRGRPGTETRDRRHETVDTRPRKGRSSSPPPEVGETRPTGGRAQRGPPGSPHTKMRPAPSLASRRESHARRPAIRPFPCCLRYAHDAREESGSVRGNEETNGRGSCSAASGVRLAAVVRLAAACAEFTSLCLCHSAGERTRRPPIPARKVGGVGLDVVAVSAGGPGNILCGPTVRDVSTRRGRALAVFGIGSRSRMCQPASCGAPRC